ncbi:MAG: hypothetical protein E7017_01555 [Alphaproteobacteria bacterium]|nr:hypothetical protein [Alphaproteobacteria bacterium]
MLYEKSTTFFVALMKTLDFYKKELIVVRKFGKEITMFLYMSKQAKSKKMIGSISPVVVVWRV